jgi:predicted metal-binding protein
MVIAEKWGCPPWVITGEEANEMVRQKWYERGLLYYTQVNIKQDIELRKLTNAG